jgi:hypothetical protein
MAEVKPLKLASGIITELGSSDTIPASAVPVASLGVPVVLATTVRNCSNTKHHGNSISKTNPKQHSKKYPITNTNKYKSSNSLTSKHT